MEMPIITVVALALVRPLQSASRCPVALATGLSQSGSDCLDRLVHGLSREGLRETVAVKRSERVIVAISSLALIRESSGIVSAARRRTGMWRLRPP
jgi:hypothetical protein